MRLLTGLSVLAALLFSVSVVADSDEIGFCYSATDCADYSFGYYTKEDCQISGGYSWRANVGQGACFNYY